MPKKNYKTPKIDAKNFVNTGSEILLKKARKLMYDIAVDCSVEGQRRAPFLEGHLTRSGGVVDYEGKPISRMEGNKIFVAFGGNESQPYALRWHENDFELGEGSEAKQAAEGVKVGKGYMVRGYHENEARYQQIIRSQKA